MQVKNLDHTVSITAFTNGLRANKDFTKSLTKKSPKVSADLLLRAEKYINTEEAMMIKYKDHDKITKKYKKRDTFKEEELYDTTTIANKGRGV